MRSDVPTAVTVRITIFQHMTLCHLLETDSILREPAFSFTVEYTGSNFLQNVGKSVPQHMAWRHITEEGTFQIYIPVENPYIFTCCNR
jgi:hypothetical protein